MTAGKFTIDLTGRDVRAVIRNLREPWKLGGGNVVLEEIASQLESQCPLDIGWHEVRQPSATHTTRALWWDGEEWRVHSSTEFAGTRWARESYVSTQYLGGSK